MGFKPLSAAAVMVSRSTALPARLVASTECCRMVLDGRLCTNSQRVQPTHFVTEKSATCLLLAAGEQGGAHTVQHTYTCMLTDMHAD